MIPVDAKTAADAAKAVKAGDLPPPAKTLAEALARIYADGGRYVQKTGQMQGPMRYTFAREGDFIAVLRPLMETHGVTVRPVEYQIVTNEPFERAKGGTSYRVVVLATFELLHVSGDKAQVQTVGEGQDAGDKAFNKAMTGAMKYALRQSFLVETGDDPDDTSSVEHERAAADDDRADDRHTVAKYAQSIAQTKDSAGLKAVGAAIKFDFDNGHLTPAGRGHLGGLWKQREEELKGVAS